MQMWQKKSHRLSLVRKSGNRKPISVSANRDETNKNGINIQVSTKAMRQTNDREISGVAYGPGKPGKPMGESRKSFVT